MRKSNGLDLSIRYKKSILLDSMFSMFPEILFAIFYSPLKNTFTDSMFFVFFWVGITSLVFFFLSDIIFFKRSPGKRIYHIQILNKSEGVEKPPLLSYIFRRLLEATIHPLFTRSFSEKVKQIDRMTNSLIEWYKK